MKIKAQNDIIAFREEPENLNSGAIDIYNIECEFSSEWDSLTKVAVLLKKDEDEGIEIALTEDKAKLPYLTDSSIYYIGLIGYMTDGAIKTKQISTNLISFWVDAGAGTIVTIENEVPEADIWEQYLSIINGIYNDTLTVKDTTEVYRDTIYGYMNTTEGYKDTTKDYMNTTEGYKDTTKDYMDTTEGYKDLAYGYKEEAEESATKAQEEADRALNNILNGVSIHNQDVESHSTILEDIRTVEAIARGKATGYVFDTYEDMLDWLEIPDNVEKLVVGDNLYIRDIEVKDYWWDGETYQELEAEAPDLTNYYTKEQVDSKMPILITRADYNALVSAGTVQADRTYDIIEEV